MCRFYYPKDLQIETTIVTDETTTLLIACNDGLLNTFNTVQLTGWHANVDMHYIVSRKKVIEYCIKYVTKSESRSQSLRHVYITIVRNLIIHSKLCRRYLSIVSGKGLFCTGNLLPFTSITISKSFKGFHCC